MAIRTLLLDIMDTVVVDPIHNELPAFFGLDLDGYYAAKTKDVWLAFERNELSESEYLAQMFADGREVDGNGLKFTLMAAYRFVDGMEPLLAELKRSGVHVHALSNYPVWYQWIESRLRLSRYLEWSFVSCETGVRKPDPAAFTQAAEALGVEPAECLFVDDRQKNVDGALEVGMPAVRFEDAASLRRTLVAAGIL